MLSQERHDMGEGMVANGARCICRHGFLDKSGTPSAILFNIPSSRHTLLAIPVDHRAPLPAFVPC